MAGYQYRKKTRDAILSLLTANFNTTLAALASSYGITPFTLDFSAASINFAVSHIDENNIENCQIEWSSGVSVGGCLYTSDALDENSVHALNFSGKLFANLDFFVRDRQGKEGFNTEDFFDCIEDAAMNVLNDPASYPPGVLFQRQSEMQRGAIIPLSDGFATTIPIKTLFEVYVN